MNNKIGEYPTYLENNLKHSKLFRKKTFTLNFLLDKGRVNRDRRANIPIVGLYNYLYMFFRKGRITNHLL